VLVTVAQLLRRTRQLRFAWPYHLFAGAFSLALAVHLSDWVSPWRGAVLAHLTAVAVILAAFPLTTLLNRLLWVRTGADGGRSEAPRVLVDATGLVVAGAAVLVALQFIYGIPVPGLIAGSGVAALVLGLGMQEQLQNLFAGITLHFEKPFKTGDWLLIDGHHAKVIDISWRATRLLTPTRW